MIDLPIPDPIKVDPNPEFVALLKRARKMVWKGRGRRGDRPRFICMAIKRVAAPGQSATALRLQQEIEGRMQTSTYVGWLHNRMGPAHWDAWMSRIQAARLRWIDQMIVEYGGTP